MKRLRDLRAALRRWRITGIVVARVRCSPRGCYTTCLMTTAIALARTTPQGGMGGLLRCAQRNMIVLLPDFPDIDAFACLAAKAMPQAAIDIPASIPRDR